MPIDEPKNLALSTGFLDKTTFILITRQLNMCIHSRAIRHSNLNCGSYQHNYMDLRPINSPNAHTQPQSHFTYIRLSHRALCVYKYKYFLVDLITNTDCLIHKIMHLQCAL